VSTLITSTLLGTSANNWAIDVESDSYLYQAGMIIQTVYQRAESQATFAAPVSGGGTTITPLQISITPKRADSLLLCTWMLNGEVNNNSVFTIHKDGALITTAGYEAYNNVVGDVRYSGVVSAPYDVDTNSTMSNYYFQYVVPAGATTAATYAPAVRSAGASAYTFYLNRTAGSAGTDQYEISVSSGMIQEIAQ
jgi:hypothetical protein